MYDFNREALAIEIDLNISVQRVVRVLDQIAANQGYPLKIRKDNGPELISLRWHNGLKSMARYWNFLNREADTEHFNWMYRTEILDFYLFRTLNEAREITERWLNEYNSERPPE